MDSSILSIANRSVHLYVRLLVSWPQVNLVLLQKDPKCNGFGLRSKHAISCSGTIRMNDRNSTKFKKKKKKCRGEDTEYQLSS